MVNNSNKKLLIEKNKSNKLVINPLTIKSDLKSNKGNLIKKILIKPFFPIQKNNLNISNFQKINNEKLRLERLKKNFNKFIGHNKKPIKILNIKKIKNNYKIKSKKKLIKKPLIIRKKNIKSVKISPYFRNLLLGLRTSNSFLNKPNLSKIFNNNNITNKSIKFSKQKKFINKFKQKKFIKFTKQFGLKGKKNNKIFKKNLPRYVIKNLNFFNKINLTTKNRLKLNVKPFFFSKFNSNSILPNLLEQDKKNRLKKFKNNYRAYLFLSTSHNRNFNLSSKYVLNKIIQKNIFNLYSEVIKPVLNNS